MYKNKKIVAIVTARGGSKGLPKKNVKIFCGKPLIAWTIEQSKKSKYVDQVIVSTDDNEIAEVSKQFGADVPFLRPESLSSDESKSIDVVMHAINWLEDNNCKHDLLMLLQPTSPLRSVNDIDNAIELLFEKEAQAIVSVCMENHPIHWTNVLPENGCMKSFLSAENDNAIRQEFQQFYKLNGALYVSYCDYLKQEKSFIKDKTYAYIMPRERSLDIDDEIDFKFAEFMMSEGDKIKKS